MSEQGYDPKLGVQRLHVEQANAISVAAAVLSTNITADERDRDKIKDSAADLLIAVEEAVLTSGTTVEDAWSYARQRLWRQRNG